MKYEITKYEEMMDWLPHIRKLRLGDELWMRPSDERYLTAVVRRHNDSPMMIEYTDPYTFETRKEWVFEYESSYIGGEVYPLYVPVRVMYGFNNAISAVEEFL